MRKICLIAKENAEVFNSYFNNAVMPLNLQCDREYLSDISDENDPIMFYCINVCQKQVY